MITFDKWSQVLVELNSNRFTDLDATDLRLKLKIIKHSIILTLRNFTMQL